jgi:hypothetical protein
MSYEPVGEKSLDDLLATLEKVYRDYPEYHDPGLGTGDFEDMVEKFAVDDFYNLHFVAQAYLKERYNSEDRFVRQKTSEAFKTADDVEKLELGNEHAWEELLEMDNGTRVWLHPRLRRFCVFRREGEVTFITRLSGKGFDEELTHITAKATGLSIHP